MGFLSSLSPMTWVSVALGLVVAFLVADVSVRKTQLANAKQEFAEYRLTQEEAAKEAERRFKERLEAQVQETAKVEEKYEKDLDSTNDKLNDALRRMRLAQASARARKPAEAAPAECKAYEAPASQLSLKDREFLVRIGAEADALAAQVVALQEYIRKVILEQ